MCVSVCVLRLCYTCEDLWLLSEKLFVSVWSGHRSNSVSSVRVRLWCLWPPTQAERFLGSHSSFLPDVSHGFQCEGSTFEAAGALLVLPHRGFEGSI